MTEDARQTMTLPPEAPAPPPAPEAQGILRDTIFVSLEDWDEIWRRNQFLVAEMARLVPQHKFLFVGLPTDVTNQIRRGNFSVLRTAIAQSLAKASPEALPNVFLLNGVKWLPNTLAVGRRFNEWHERRQVRRAAQQVGLKKPLLWLNPQSAVHMVGQMDERGVVYDITDDWSSITQSEKSRQSVIDDDAKLCRKADLVVVCSERLYEMKRDMARNLSLIPNGVEAERYRLVCSQEPGGPSFAEAEKILPLPQAAKEWPRPVIGYTGTVHSDRVDLRLVAALARKFPHVTIPLIGQSMLEAPEKQMFADLPNVKMVGPVPYRDLQAWMRAFDVCIVPHRVTVFTESLNPLKLFEYLAAGLPIVSTDVAGFRDYGQKTAKPLVYIAEGTEGEARDQAFFGAVQQALAEHASPAEAARLREMRQKEASLHTWQARLGQLLKAMQEAITRS